MKNLLKLSALAAVLVASATYASAQIITASGSTTNYDGYSTGTGGVFNDTTTANLLLDEHGASTNAVTVLSSFGSWQTPAAGSSWVSFENSAPVTGGLVPPNGYYTFNSASFAGGVSGNLSVMADDTVAVFDVNNGGSPVLLIDAVIDTLPGQDGHCSLNTPNCNSLDTIAWTAPSGTNVLWFVVEQTGGSAMGLDYEFAASVPEPSTLLMLGTGLVGSAGALFRRMRK